MKSNITHLSQLKERHQAIVDQPGHCPSQRWELWGRIHQAENLLEDVGAGSPGTNQHRFAARKRFAHQRTGRTLAVLASTMLVLAVASWLARDYVRPEASVSFAGTAVVTGLAATLFAARAEDYHRVVELFESADEFEPRPVETPIEVAFEEADEYEWIWVDEDDSLAHAPIFNAVLQVPLLTV